MNTREFSIDKYIEVLSSASPIPGGGGASAVVGALAASLSLMVCNLTLGKKKFISIEEEIKKIVIDMNNGIRNLLDLADKDAKVFEPLAKAYSLPTNTEEEKKQKEDIMEPLLLEAALVPLNIMREAFSLFDSIEYLAKNASKLAISDAGVAANNLRSCILSAFLNVKINTKYMKNIEKITSLEKEAKLIVEETRLKSDEIYEIVLKEL